MLSIDRVSRMRFPFGGMQMLSFLSIWRSCLTTTVMGERLAESSGVFYDQYCMKVFKYTDK